MVIPLGRLGPSAGVKEKQLLALLGERPGVPDSARRDLVDAQILGSLELAGVAATWSDVTADRLGGAALAPPIAALKAAQAAVDAQQPFSADAVVAWQHALAGTAMPRPEVAAAGSIESLAEWMNSPSALSLSAARQGALVLGRLAEIGPYGEDGGLLARLAASHVMVRAGTRPPILVGADRQRYDLALDAARALATEGLVALLDEAAARALDVLLQSVKGNAR